MRAIQLKVISLGEHDNTIVIVDYDRNIPGTRQAEILAIMSDQPQRAWSEEEIARRVRLWKGRVHDILEALVTKGWAQRIDAVNNKSASVHYQITPEGKAMHLAVGNKDDDAR